MDMVKVKYLSKMKILHFHTRCYTDKHLYQRYTIISQVQWVTYTILFQCCCNCIVYVYAVCSPVHLKGAQSCLITGYLLLALYHARFSQDLT